MLLALVVLGLAFILSSMLDSDKSSLQKLFSEFSSILKTDYSYQCDLILDLWSYYLPFIYSCVSFMGVLLLLGNTSI
jgi:hypothetical protein